MSQIDTQLRLLLETQCSKVARELLAAVQGIDFVLFLFDEGASGHMAFLGTKTKAENAALVTEWVEIQRGKRPRPVIAVADPAQVAATGTRTLEILSGFLSSRLPAGVLFSLVVFDFLVPGHGGYTSSARRDGAVEVLERWLQVEASTERPPPVGVPS